MPADLTARIRERLDEGVDIVGKPGPYIAAIRAILDRHQQEPLSPWPEASPWCSCEQSYPCPTIQVIAEAFDIKEEPGDA